MSPRSRGRRDDRRRPSDRRRARRRSTGTTSGESTATEPSQSSTDQVEEFVTQVLAASGQLLTLDSPLQVEGFVASVIGSWWQHPTPTFGPVLVERAQRAATPEAVALLHGLAAIAEPGLAALARTALDGLGDPTSDLPPWAALVGRAVLQESFTLEEEFGDATQVIMTFSYDAARSEPVDSGAKEPAHALVVLVDHNLGGIAKDLWATDHAPGLLEQVRSTVAGDQGLTLTEADPSALRVALQDALDATEQTIDAPLGESFRDLRALLVARIRSLPEGATAIEPTELPDAEREEIVADFASSPEATDLPVEAARTIAAEIVGYGCDQDRGQPLRVSPGKLEVFLFAWLPRTGLLDQRYVGDVPAVLPAWVRYAGRRTGLSEEAVAETLAALETLVPRFAPAYEDRDNWGPARIAVDSLLADMDPDEDNADEVFERRMFALDGVPAPGFDVTDAKAVQRLVEEENKDGKYDYDSSSEERLHVVLLQQLWFDDPSQVWETAVRLLDAGYERTEIFRALMSALSERPQDREAGLRDADGYLEALAALPETWAARHPAASDASEASDAPDAPDAPDVPDQS
ncbi:hypothetical protein [Actinopolymorpha pittospori]